MHIDLIVVLTKYKSYFWLKIPEDNLSSNTRSRSKHPENETKPT